MDFIENYIKNFNIDNVIQIIIFLLNSGIGIFLINAYKKLKNQTVEDIIKNFNNELYEKLEEKIKELDEKIAQVNNNVVLTNVNKMSSSDLCLKLLDNTNMNENQKNEVRQTINNLEVQEEQEKQEKIQEIENIEAL